MSFENAISRNLYGDKVILSISNENEEYFFYPKKFSVQGQDELNSYTAKQRKMIDPKTAKNLMELYKANPGMKEEELISKLSGEELLQLQSTAQSEIKNEERYRLYFKYGIGKNNLNDKDDEKEGLTEKAIKSILDNRDIAEEIYFAILNFNNFFLAKPTEKN